VPLCSVCSAVQLNGHRCIEGTLRGYDQFINLTLADAVDKTVTGTSAASNRDLGMVVCCASWLSSCHAF